MAPPTSETDSVLRVPTGFVGPGSHLEPPVAHAAMLVRERLLDRLRARWLAPVTVVSAPAGYGKTTLLAQAIAANAAAPMGVDCWLACGPDAAEASSLGDGLCRAVDALPVTGSGGAVDVARAVVDAMWRRSPQQVVLVIDDVHEIPAGTEAARLLESVVGSLPANGHLVLAGRQPPPVPLARLEVAGGVVRVDQADMAFTDAEVVEFAALRKAPSSQVAACGGWPALAELYARARSSAVGDYVAEEVLHRLSPAERQALGLLAHLGAFDEDLARCVLGPDVDVRGLLADVPLVSVTAEREWRVHSLWRSLLARAVTPAQVAEAHRRAGLALMRRGRAGRAVRSLIDAEAWDELTRAIVEALGAAHPPVARDVLAGWSARLPAEVRAAPVGRLLAAVLAADGDPDEARHRFEDCGAAFRRLGDTAGELACLVQLGQMAWWSDDPQGLAAVAARVFELEAAGCEEVAPIACLGRALLFDIDNDSRRMLAELDRIVPGSLNHAWRGIVSWARAIGLLELGQVPQALEAADRALADAVFLHAPLAQTTRLQALWYQGKAGEVLDALPAVLERILESGYRNHAALVAAQCSMVHAFRGQTARAAGYLDQARAAAVVAPDAPLADAAVSVAAAAVAVGDGDEESAAAALAAHLDRYPVGEGVAAASQQRHLALFYLLVPAIRPVWDRAELGPAWAFGRDLARALVAVREGRGLPPGTPGLDEAALVQAHLPPPWVAELAVGAIASGREDGWQLLDGTWPLTHPVVADLARRGGGPLRRAARTAVGRLPVPPTRRLALRLLGPVDLCEGDAPVAASDWRRERVRSLLAYLAVHGAVSREQVAGDLWPGLDLEAQSRNLRVTLSYLLRVLEPGRAPRDPSFFVRHHGGNVSLHAGEWLSVDVWDFDAHCQRASDADRQGMPAAALDHALRAVELWRGDPIELASEPWAIVTLEQRRIRFAATATRAGELLLARNDTDQAHALAERALAVDPWLEATHRLVVAAHRARRDELGARRALSRYREAIHELGLGPDEATLMVERLVGTLPTDAGGAAGADAGRGGRHPGSGPVARRSGSAHGR